MIPVVLGVLALAILVFNRKLGGYVSRYWGNFGQTMPPRFFSWVIIAFALVVFLLCLEEILRI